MPKVNPRPGDLVSWLRRLEKRIKALESSPRLRNSSIRGGTLTILDDAGIPILRIGDLPYGNEIGVQTYDPVDGSRIMFSGYVPSNEDTEFIVRREDGSAALEMFNGGQGAGSPQFIAMLDRAGYFVHSDDTNTGHGMSAPYVCYYAAPDLLGGGAFSNGWMTINTGTYTNLWQINAPVWSPYVYIRVLAWGNNAAGSFILYDETDGRQIGSALTIASGVAATLEFDSQVLSDSYPALKEHDLRIRAKRTSGTGTVQGIVTAAYGHGS